jgi:NAD(P)-dependent dehydrogenase (short-subunit alcohol dehydrogenase family)
MANWTKNNIPDQSGKTIIVTGGNTGLGYEAVRLLSKNNAEVILAARNLHKGNDAKSRIVNEFPAANIKVMRLDLGDLQSVHKFCAKFNREHKRLDVLLNNAGVMWSPYSETKDGFESQMGVNHFGHFALTGLLFDKLKQTKNARIVNVSSIGHRSAKFDVNEAMFNENNYNRNLAYYKLLSM